MKKSLGLCIALFGIVVICLAFIFSCFFVTVRFPQQTCAGTIKGRFCVYSHSLENYTGKGIFNPLDPSDPYNCYIDNGTFLFAGCKGRTVVYAENGYLISDSGWEMVGDWILKNQSGVLIYDLEIG